MEHGQERIRQLAIQFQRCQKTLAAIGDPTRQQIVLALLSGGCRGVRVGEVPPRRIPSPGYFEGGWTHQRTPGGDKELLLF